MSKFGQMVRGTCPACKSRSLFLGQGGYVTCGYLRCPDPCAADKLLWSDEERACEMSGTELMAAVDEGRGTAYRVELLRRVDRGGKPEPDVMIEEPMAFHGVPAPLGRAKGTTDG